MNSRRGGGPGIVLSFVQRIEFGDRDLYGAAAAEVHPAPVCDAVPVLDIRSGIGTLLEGLFPAPELAACDRYHKMKAAELFMLIKLLYTSSEHAYFFQSLVRPRDDFRSFVSNNYERAGSVAELAALAGMSLSAFKRRFAEHFEESVYRWMMHRKGAPHRRRYPRRRTQHACADGQIRIPPLYAVQPLLQELPACHPGAADRCRGPSLTGSSGLSL